MGNAAAFLGWGDIGAPKKEGTTLIELRINHVRDAHGIIGMRPNDAFTPVTLHPENAMAFCCCIPLCYVAIPAGMSAIVTKFGAVVKGDLDDGTWSPGCHCFSPLYTVDKLVSKQLIVFDTPVKDCKTKDVITVNLDVMLQFEIKEAPLFVYSIGPEKFDDYLRASQDEILRKMAMETPVESIYDLSGQQESTHSIIEELNNKFSKYGVQVHHLTVKSVKLPKEMANDFEQKTLFDSKTVEQRKKQEIEKLKLNNDEGKQKLREECDNKRMAADQQAEVDKNKAMKEVSAVVSKAAKDIEELEAERDHEVKRVLTSAELEVSKMKSDIMAMERDKNSRIQAECAQVRNDADAYSARVDTQRTVEDAKKMASGNKALAEAEGLASAAFVARRANEAEMKRLDILQKVTQKEGTKIATSQENTVRMNADNQAVTQVAHQGLEALRAMLAEVTATSLQKLEQPSQQTMRVEVIPSQRVGSKEAAPSQRLGSKEITPAGADGATLPVAAPPSATNAGGKAGGKGGAPAGAPAVQNCKNNCGMRAKGGKFNTCCKSCGKSGGADHDGDCAGAAPSA